MPQRERVIKVFQVCDKSGKIVRLVEAETVAQVKAHILDGAEISVASALTVARAGLETEKAGE